VIHLNEMQLLGFGELDGTRSARIEAVNENLSGANFEVQLSTRILQTCGRSGCSLPRWPALPASWRAALGDIATAGGTDIALALFEECSAIAAKNGYARTGDWRADP